MKRFLGVILIMSMLFVTSGSTFALNGDTTINLHDSQVSVKILKDNDNVRVVQTEDAEGIYLVTFNKRTNELKTEIKKVKKRTNDSKLSSKASTTELIDIEKLKSAEKEKFSQGKMVSNLNILPWTYISSIGAVGSFILMTGPVGLAVGALVAIGASYFYIDALYAINDAHSLARRSFEEIAIHY